MTPQIDHLGKTNPVLRVSTHIYGISKDIGGKAFIFQGKPRHVTLQINCLGKMSTVLRVSTHIYGLSEEIDGKIFILQSKCRHVTLQIISSRKNEALF